MAGSDDATLVPPVSTFLQNGFHAFLGRMLRRNFHAVAVVRETLAFTKIPADEPLIVYSNHPSWWDPLIAHYLCRHLFSPRQFYAPIDASALEQYRVFAKLGFYGVRLNSTSGSAAFLKTSRAILATPASSIWITPEGRFADPRDLDTPLAPGLAHLCSRVEAATVLPLAMEFVFWEERLPECLIRFGSPRRVTDHRNATKAEWTESLTQNLRDTQRELARSVIARDAAPFEPLLKGGKGAGGLYQALRRLRSWFGGQPLAEQHGEKFR